MIRRGKKSLIRKVFFKIACLFIGMTLIISFSIAKYANNIMTDEIIHFSQAIAKELSEDISGVVMDGVYLGERIAYNTGIIENLKSKTSHEDQLKELAEEVMNDYTWLQSQQHKRLYDVYIMDKEGNIRYRSDNSSRGIELQIDKVREDVSTITSTIKDPEAQGIYQNVFQIHEPVRDHLNKEMVGKVVINVTEKVLYDCYANRNQQDRTYRIIDKEGYIISDKDKRQVGERYIPLGRTVNQSYTALDGWMTYKADKQSYNIFYTKVPATEWYIVEELDLKNMMKPITNIKIYIYLCLSVLIIISIFVLKDSSRELSTPVQHIKRQMKKVTQGTLDAYIEEVGEDEFGQIAESFNEMIRQIAYLMEEVKYTEKQKRLAELDFLKSQMNPHFIYNTLSSIRFYVEMGKNREAEEMLFYFSKILRSTLSATNQFIKIEDELKIIENYAALQQLRYTDAFEIKNEMPCRMLQQKIPHFILQPIIENAIFYAINKSGGKCIIEIGGRIEDKYMLIWIKDDGIGMSKDKIREIFSKDHKMNSIGIRNVHERIQLNYGKDYGLEIESEEGKGVQVFFKFPNERGIDRC